MLLTEEEARRAAERALELSRADHCTVWASGSESSNLRFARNAATTNGRHSEVSVSVKSCVGQRSATVSVSSTDNKAIAHAVARSEELARLAPVDPEFMPPLGPQDLGPQDYHAGGEAYHAPTTEVSALALAEAAGKAVAAASEAGLDGAGYVEAGGQFTVLANSAGLRASERLTGAGITVSARRKGGGGEAGQWSGWSAASALAFDRLDAGDVARRAVSKAAAVGAPIDIEPGGYTVILEPAAVAEALQWLVWYMDARAADEGRSYFSRKDGGSKRGEKLFDERVTIVSDPADPVTPDGVIGSEALPQRRTAWIENGVVGNLRRSRFWAQKTGREPLSGPRNIVMKGGPAAVDDMIAGVKRGVLITRLWYTNMLDPRTLLLTGLTRDGNFLIEDGRIVGPARNLRFNESLVAMLNEVEAMGPSVRVRGGASGEGAISAPAMLVRNFRFSSRTSGI
jgi:predicted Zn-dependent protease